MPAGQIITVLVTINFNLMWLTLYGLCIRRGFRDQAFGIPLVALCANFAWDVLSSTNGQAMPMPQPIINGIYAIIDLVIIYQVLRFWRSDFPSVTPTQFYLFFAFTVVFTFWLMSAFIQETNDIPTWRVAFIDTFINSALFIAMFYRRPGLEGQSIYIGLCKLWGTGLFMLMLAFAPQLGVADFYWHSGLAAAAAAVDWHLPDGSGVCAARLPAGAAAGHRGLAALLSRQDLQRLRDGLPIRHAQQPHEKIERE
ncbi:hypothetical protein HC776_00040 [bacterium]|nr:hypothetical protein [bacterium]